MTIWKLYRHAHDNLLFERESIDGLSHSGALNILQIGDQLLFGDGESATRHPIFKMIHQKRYDIIHHACMNKTVVLGKSMKSYPEV